ncbi:MAG: CDP-diacylglycerol--serine O-phosphatidyltransferase [Chlorobi bacterium]|nr:CDP-diacylglycerol--serine O-phosphatidyltransferase [Chlorobiota bacterium]
MKIRVSRSVLPSLFTIMNLFFGFLSIIYAFRNEPVMAAWYIVFGAVFDALDGVMARLTKSSSEFGVELDSLCDAVTFGAAPSFLIYSMLYPRFEVFGILVASMPLIFGVLRLARFNVQLTGFNKDHFHGVPTPISALVFASFVFFFDPLALTELQLYMLVALTITISFLMVSTIWFPVLPKPTKRDLREHPVVTVIFYSGVVVAAITKGKWLFPAAVGAILLTAGISLWKFVARVFRKTEDEEDEDAEPVTANHS